MNSNHHPSLLYNLNLNHSLHGKYEKVAALLKPQSRILELGCSTGYFSDALTRLGHHVLGLEADSHAVECCKNRGIEALVADLASPSALSVVKAQQFDAVLAMDILEHLPMPERLLRAIRAALKPDGQLIVTGPNVAYWALRWKLLCGRWDYARTGIMDESHLRWFTRRTWRALIQSSGFSIHADSVAEAMLPKEQWLRSLGLPSSAIEHLRRAVARLFPSLFATVFIFAAAPHRSRQ